MLRLRYPLLVFATFAVVVVGYVFWTGRNTTESVRELVDLQARRVADLVAEAALRNDEVRRLTRDQYDRFDSLVMEVLAAQVERESVTRLANLEGRLKQLRLDRALLVDGAGHVIVETGRPRRPGKRDRAPLEGVAESRMLAVARDVAAGGAPPTEARAPFRLQPRRRTYRRVAGRYCLVLERSEATVQAMRLETGLDDRLAQFREDPSIAFVRVEDASGALVAGFGEPPTDRVVRERRRVLSGGHTLRVGIDMPEARAIERRARQVPLLVGLALLVLGGAAMALVFRLQSAHLRAQVRADQDRRFASLGQLTAGVAHEIRNPLNTIRLSVGRLRRRGGDTTILNAVGDSVGAIDATVADFLKLARDPRPALEAHDVASVLREAAGQVQPMAASNGRRVELDGDGAIARLDPARLREALVNLLRNAVQASRATVAARVRRDNGRVLIEVDDDGPGIEPARRREIFEFFYTTKAQGTGLGLPLAHRVAEEHGGALDVSDAPRGGSRFTLSLPGIE